MGNIKIVGIDIAKNIFQLYGADCRGKKLLSKRLTRNKLVAFIEQLSRGLLIVMEACSSANYWARKFISMGFHVKLISPQCVKPFVKGNKNDKNDVQAIVEAALRPDMKFVPIKTLEQQAIQSLHRARQLTVKSRTAYVNQIRGLLAEYGVIIAQGVLVIRTKLTLILEDAENELTYSMRVLISDIYEQFKLVDKKVREYDEQLAQIARSKVVCQQLMKLPGIGPMTATAVVSAVGDGKVFKRGREMAAWLGLTPRHRASGQKQIIQGISKRGDAYLRTLIIHGSRSVLRHCKNKTDRRSRWILDKVERLGSNKAAVALANKTVREIWAALHKGEQFVHV
jgi:transposase